MYLTIDQTDYAALRNLAFSPQTDITGDTIPINEFSVDIVTDDTIATGQYVDLYDDLDNLWAHYWITYAERNSEETVQIKARCDIALMDGVTLAAVHYDNAAIADVLNATIVRNSGAGGVVATLDYSLASAFSSATITGCCPEQSARERLQWICLILGAYVQTCFNDEIEIKAIGSTATIIPIERTTFWRPAVTYNDYVTGVEITGYSFAQGTPGVGDEYIEVGNDTYIATGQKYALSNSSAPSTAADNVIKIEGVYIANANNAGGILANVASYRFNRTEVRLDVINNGEYIPGMLVQFYTSESTMMQGYIQSCAFKFGLQARSTLHIIGGVEIETANLTVKYKFGNRTIDKKAIPLPIGFTYSVENPWFDVEIKGHRYVLRPTTEAVTGTMTSGGKTATVSYEAALDLYEGVLTVSNVDEITTQTEDNVVVGVIS